MIRTLIPLLLLAACGTVISDTPATGAPPAAPSACGADELGGMVGASASQVQQAAGMAITRVHAEGDAVTRDVLPERLNIVTDGAGTVVALRCG